ncbi:hypothetical protein [uncultured Pantoea sp.]|uniref:hypothetical protein n=1 Tax=uncultured Pantoea sp. TaxID=218084 RepID=UPI002584C0F7|nr:hypothetical protein [uncultured Pantoea sp.]
MIIEDAERYLKLFQEEKVAFDYSRLYQESMLENKQCYSTVSHPNNKHLSVF